MTMGEAIRYYRKQRRLSQTALALKIGMRGRSSIAYYEHNQHDPRLSCLRALAEALEVPVCQLIGGHPPQDGPRC